MLNKGLCKIHLKNYSFVQTDVLNPVFVNGGGGGYRVRVRVKVRGGAAK